MSFISEVSSSSFFHSSKTSFFWNDLRRKWTCKNLIEVKRGHQKNPRICLYDGFWSNALGYFLRVKWLQMLFQFISFEWDKSLKTNEIKIKTASNTIYWVIKWSRIWNNTHKPAKANCVSASFFDKPLNKTYLGFAPFLLEGWISINERLLSLVN